MPFGHTITILGTCLPFFVSPHIVQIALSNRMEAAASTSSFLQQYLVSSHNIWSSLPTKYQLCANLAPPPSYQGSEEYTKGQFRIFGFLVFPYPPFLFLRVAVKEMTQGCICLSLYLAQKSVRGEGDVGFNR